MLGLTLYPFDLDTPAFVRVAQRAEAAGFDAVFVVEQGVSNDAMAAVLAIALGTRRIAVGPGIANLYFRHPFLLGATAVAVDELSGGRLVLGIGSSNEGTVRALGLPWREPRSMLREATGMLRQVFAGQTPPGLRGAFRAARRAIPIHLAGVALETAALAGEIADGLMLYLATPARVRQVLDRMTAAARAAGRPAGAVQATLLVPTFLSDDLAAAREAARAFLGRYATMPLYAKMFRRSGFDPDAISDRMLDEVLLVGPLARCRERLAAFREAGADAPLIAPQPIGEGPEAAARRVIAAFAR